MSTKQTPPIEPSKVPPPSGLGAIRRIIAGRRAQKDADTERVRVEDLYPSSRSDEPRNETRGDENSEEWARHVEWTLRLMS